MGANPILSAWDTFILIIPFFGFLGMAMFRLDGWLARSKSRPGKRRLFCEVGGEGRSFLCDPDGKPWQKGAVRQIEARFAPRKGARWNEALREDRNGQRRAARAYTYIIEN